MEKYRTTRIRWLMPEQGLEAAPSSSRSNPLSPSCAPDRFASAAPCPVGGWTHVAGILEYFFIHATCISLLFAEGFLPYKFQPFVVGNRFALAADGGRRHLPRLVTLHRSLEFNYIRNEHIWTQKQNRRQIKNKYLDRKHMCTLYWGARICVFWKPSISWLHQY